MFDVTGKFFHVLPVFLLLIQDAPQTFFFRSLTLSEKSADVEMFDLALSSCTMFK